MLYKMKGFITAALILTALITYAQGIQPLNRVESTADIKPQEAIIYGSFLQRLTFWQNGYGQNIRIRNIKTKELFLFEVKPSLKTRKENTFCFYIPPGTYEVLSYYYSKAKWYGTQGNLSPVFKNMDFEVNLKNKVDSGLIKVEDLHRIVFTVESGVITYLGKWHFDAGPVSFSDDKATLDKKIQQDFYFLRFDKAVTVIPD